jgi:threonine synthase
VSTVWSPTTTVRTKTTIETSNTERELDRLHRAGFYTEPRCAVAPAALAEYRERGALDRDDGVVVAPSGSGPKG